MTEPIHQLLRLVLDESAPATALVEVVLSPAGIVKSSKGRFVMDERSFAEILRRFHQRGNELPIDYEHQSLPEYNTRADGKAPAAGWIKSLAFDPQRGLVAQVEWTADARDEILAKKYRYISPVIKERKRDGRAIELHSAAVTNVPAIYGMAALAASHRRPVMAKKIKGKTEDRLRVLSDELFEKLVLQDEETAGAVESELDTLTENIMGLRAVLVAGGKVDEGASPEDVVKAALALISGMGTGAPPPSEEMSAATDAQSALCERLALKDAGWKDIVKAVDEHIAKAPSPESYKALSDKLQALEGREAKRSADALVQAYVDDGKLLPSDEKKMDWARKMALKDSDSFKELMDGAPRLYEPGAILTGNDGKPINERDTVIAKAFREWNSSKESDRRGFKAVDVINGELATRSMPLISKKELEALEVK